MLLNIFIGIMGILIGFFVGYSIIRSKWLKAEIRLEEQQKHFEMLKVELEKQFDQRTQLMKEEFQTLSTEILERKSGNLQSANKEQLDNILNPLKEKIVNFEKSLQDNRMEDAKYKASFEKVIEEMMKQTQALGKDANNLARALKGDNKMQGDWGEMVLDELLRESGLQEGIHYEVQSSITDEDGRTIRNEDNKMMRPDVVVHYPDGKDVIVDSKVSLVAYIDYVNAESDAQRQDALQRHLKSVKSHVDELASKNYAAYLKKQSREAVDFVVMFIPNESPHQLALIQDPKLFRYAKDKKVLIVSPVNLMALLQVIHIGWTRADQEKNQLLILEMAGQLLERLYTFYEQFDEVGKELEDAVKSYNNSVLKLEDGSQSIVKKAEQLKLLGVKMKKDKNLPKRFQLEE